MLPKEENRGLRDYRLMAVIGIVVDGYQTLIQVLEVLPAPPVKSHEWIGAIVSRSRQQVLDVVVPGLPSERLCRKIVRAGWSRKAGHR